MAFQTANNIEPIGIVGPKTRLALESSLGVPSVPTGTSSYIFTRNLQKGSTGEDVRILQILLKREGYFDLEPTSYFGTITYNALVAFQKANGIDPIGIVGPKTRALLNSL